MSHSLFPSLSAMARRMRKYPQLFWTIFVAVAITAAFIFIAQMFISIAQDAQERLVNVRIGAIQDSLSEFVDLEEGSKGRIDAAIANLMLQNPTILNFTFYKKQGAGFTVFASSDTVTVGEAVTGISPAGQLALNDAKNSYTTEIAGDSERLYQTFRAITQDGQIVGLVETTQTLSEVDQAIGENIRRGLVLFTIVLILVMFLFFRHSRIIDYTTLYEELREIDRLKSDFISIASHELKTPLAAIRGYSELIADGEDVPHEYREYARRIGTSSKQLAFLVEDMLDVSKIEQGRMKFEREKILVPDLVRAMLPDFESMAKEKGLGFSLEQEGLRLGHVEGDEERLRQVLLNVVGNAIKYTKKGEVRIRLSNAGDDLEIRIVDTGIGMSEEDRKGLFQKFYRIRNEDTQEIRGTGLGLWITKQLVENMGGTVSVESIRGVGTHVVLRFPGIV